MAVQQDAVHVYYEVHGDYDRFNKVMTDRGYSDMQCLNLHRELVKERGWIDPKQPFTPRTHMQLAGDLYKEHNGDKDAVVEALVATGMTKVGAAAHFATFYAQDHARQRAEKPRPVPADTLSQAIEAIYKRTIIVVMEIEVDDIEDTHQTAELAVELLTSSMDNQITLIAATEKL